MIAILDKNFVIIIWNLIVGKPGAPGLQGRVGDKGPIGATGSAGNPGKLHYKII